MNDLTKLLVVFLVLLNNLYSSCQSLFGEERSFIDDLLDTRRNTKKVIKNGLFRPSLFHVIKFPNDECFDLSNQSGTCYTPLQCKAYGGTGTATCANGYGQCCIISRTCHNSTSQKVVYFKNPSYPQMDTIQNFCDLTIEVKDSDVCQVKLDFLDFQMDQPTDGNCLGDKLTVTATGLTPSSIPVLCGTNRNQHMFIHLPPDTKDRSISLLYETNNNGPYRWHIRITQIDCARNSYNSAYSTFGSKIYNYRSKRQISLNNNLTNFKEINEIQKKRNKRSIFINEASLRMTIPSPTGCLQYHTSNNGVIESFNFGHYYNNLDYSICIERHPNVCKVIFSCQDSSFGIEPNNVALQNNEGAAGDEQCSTDYLMIPGGSVNGDSPTKDRYCGAKLLPIDYTTNGVQLGQQVITKSNGPIILKFHSDNTLMSKLRTGFRLKYEQSTENCQVTNNLPLVSTYGVQPLNINRLNNINNPSLSLKLDKSSENYHSKFNSKKSFFQL